MNDLGNVLLYLGELLQGKKHFEMPNMCLIIISMVTHSELARCVKIHNIIDTIRADWKPHKISIVAGEPSTLYYLTPCL